MLGQSKDSARYDVVRKQCKRNPETFQDELKTLNAKFEVISKIAYEKIKKDLRSFELNKIKKNKTLNVKPNDGTENAEYKNLLKKLDKLNALKKHFEF